MHTTSDAKLISLNDIKFRYSDHAELPTLNVSSWNVDAGESVLLIGESGSGKSTLLNLLSGILAPDSGAISVAGHDLEKLSDRQRDHFRATEIGYVAQSFNLITYLYIIDNIDLTDYFGRQLKTQENQVDIESLLLKLNIQQSQWHKPVSQLSIGQQQRVAIARSIVNKPKLLIADEPTSALDQTNRDRFMSILMETAGTQNMTLVFVSHDLSLKQYFSRVDSMTDINKAEA